MLQQLGNPADLLQAGHGFDEQDIGARLGELLSPFDRGLEALDRAGVRARDDLEIRILARVGGRADLVEHFRQWRHRLAGEVAAAFREGLVLDLDGIRAGAFQRAHGVPCIDGIAESGVDVHDEGQVLHRLADPHRASATSRRPMMPRSGAP